VELLEVGSGTGGDVLAAALDRAIARQGKPQPITCDHGTEFMSRAMEDWAYRRGRSSISRGLGSPPIAATSSRSVDHRQEATARETACS